MTLAASPHVTKIETFDNNDACIVHAGCSVTESDAAPDGSRASRLTTNTEGDLNRLDLILYFDTNPGLSVGDALNLSGHWQAQAAAPAAPVEPAAPVDPPVAVDPAPSDPVAADPDTSAPSPVEEPVVATPAVADPVAVPDETPVPDPDPVAPADVGWTGDSTPPEPPSVN